jgi:hypothetical protein
MREIARPNQAPRELNQGGTSTSETMFVNSDASLAVACHLPDNVLGPNTSTGKQAMRLVLRVGGRVTGGTTTNFTPKLKWGVSTTASSNTSLEDGAAVAVNSNAGLWDIKAELIIRVTGTGTARIDGVCGHLVAGSTRTFTAVAVTDNSITTYDPTLLTSRRGFSVSGTFSSGDAGNLAYIDYFELEAIV